MPRSTKIFILILAVLALLMGYNYFARPFIKNYQDQRAEQVEIEARDEYVETRMSLLDQLSSEEKIGLMMTYPWDLDQKTLTVETTGEALFKQLDGATESATTTLSKEEQLAQLKLFKPGVIVLFGTNISVSTAQQELEQIRHQFTNLVVQPLIAVDHEGGEVQRLAGEGFSKLPAWRELCQQEQETRQELLQNSAQELGKLGINLVFAPVLDINSVVLGSRSCASFNELLDAAQDYIETFGEQQVMPVVKHFPGLGNATKDLHYAPETIALSQEDTKIFSDILELYPNIGVMVTHISLVDRLDGKPCVLSDQCLQGFAQSFPQALLVTDSLEMKSLSSFADKLLQEEFGENITSNLSASFSSEEVAKRRLAVLAKEAVLAGNIILLFGKGVTADQLAFVRSSLISEYEQNEQFQEKVNLAAAKLLAVRNLE